MVWTSLYLNMGWHIVICAIALIYGLYLVFSKEDEGFLWIVIAVVYFLFAPYAHEEQIRNCRTKNGNTASITVKFKEPIVKFVFVKPRDVKVTSIDGMGIELMLEGNSKYEVYNSTTSHSYDQSNHPDKLKLTVFEGSFKDKYGSANTLYLLL